MRTRSSLAYLAGIRSDDPNRAYRAADAWISRVHGRPKETVENVTALDDPLDVASMSREQRDALKRELLRQHLFVTDIDGGLSTTSDPLSRFGGSTTSMHGLPSHTIAAWLVLRYQSWWVRLITTMNLCARGVRCARWLGNET
jgi:hypothetical protein